MELAVKYCIVADYLIPNFLAISLGSAFLLTTIFMVLYSYHLQICITFHIRNPLSILYNRLLIPATKP